jgi:DHA1 family multidrug resistance protein-like MFS transporter
MRNTDSARRANGKGPAPARFTHPLIPRILRHAIEGNEPMNATPRSEAQPWQRTLWTMVGVQFVMSISFSILSPIMPLFLPELGVVSREAVSVWAGVLASVTSFIAIFTAPVWGSLADRYGRKLMVLRSTLGIAVFTILMGVASNPWHMLAFRAGMGALAGFNSAATVLVSTQVPEARLGYSLGWLSTGQLVGSLIGPIIGGVVADLTGSFRVPFFFAGAISLLAFLGTWRFVPERFTPPGEGRQRHSLLSGLSTLTRTTGLMALIVVMLMAQFATQAVQPVVTLFVQEMLGPRPDLATLGGLAFSVTGVAGVLAVPFLGRKSDVIGYRTVLLISLFGAALFTVPQAFRFGYWAFVAERFGLGLFVGGILPAANSLIGRLTSASSRASSMAWCRRRISSAIRLGR